MSSPDGFRSHPEPNHGERLKGGTTDEKAPWQRGLAAGNNDIVELASNHKKLIPRQRLSKVSESSQGGGHMHSGGKKNKRPRLAQAPALTAGASTKRKKEYGKNSLVKRQATQVDESGEESSPDQPSEMKRPRLKNREPNKTFVQPFACPSFRHNKTQNAECRSWHSPKILLVKQHCIAKHVKPLRCGRCRIFKAGTPDEIERHLKEGDCKKSCTPDPSEKDALAKASEVDKAKTWEKIYEVMHPQIIPDPFYEEQAQNDVVDHMHNQQTVNSYTDVILAEYDSSAIVSSQGFECLGEDVYLTQDHIASPVRNYTSNDQYPQGHTFQTSASNENLNDPGWQSLEYWPVVEQE